MNLITVHFHKVPMNDFRLQTAYQVIDGYLSLHPRADGIELLKQVLQPVNKIVTEDQSESNIPIRRGKKPLNIQVILCKNEL